MPWRWGTFNSVWRKQSDGVWKIVFDVGSPSAPPPADAVQALLDEEHGCPGERSAAMNLVKKDSAGFTAEQARKKVAGMTSTNIPRAAQIGH
jgi:hypothetical protein